MMTTAPPMAVCLTLTRAISQTRTVEEICNIALQALADGLALSRSSILLYDSDGVMRFAAWRGISAEYRCAVEGHSPWRPDTPNPEPLVVPNVTLEPSLAAFLPTIESERIAAMAFIPLVSLGRVIGKFMLYYDEPHALSTDELQLASLIAWQVAFAVERTRAERGGSGGAGLRQRTPHRGGAGAQMAADVPEAPERSRDAERGFGFSGRAAAAFQRGEQVLVLGADAI